MLRTYPDRGSSPYRAFISCCEEHNVSWSKLLTGCSQLIQQGGIIDGGDKEEQQIKDRLSYVINAIASELESYSRIRLRPC